MNALTRCCLVLLALTSAGVFAGEEKPKEPLVIDVNVQLVASETARAARLEALQKRVAELTAQAGGEMAAMAAVEADLSFLIQTAARPEDRLRALQLVTMGKWMMQLETADRDQALQLVSMPEPFAWTWPVDALRKDLRAATGEELIRSLSAPGGPEAGRAYEHLPSLEDMRLCVCGQALRKALKDRLAVEQNPILDAPLRWGVEKYLALGLAAAAQKAKPLNAEYAKKLQHAHALGDKGDRQTARAAFDEASKFRPLRALAFLERIVAELQWGAAVSLDEQSSEGKGALPCILALMTLDADDPGVAIAGATIVLKASHPSPIQIDNAARRLSQGLAVLPESEKELRQQMLGLRAELNVRLGRREHALEDAKAAGEGLAALRLALQHGDQKGAAAGFEKMVGANEMNVRDLAAGVDSFQDAAAALRIVNIPGLGALKPQPAQYADVLKHLRECQKKNMVSLEGKFRMGSQADPSEKPEHDTTLSPFRMAKCEVTVGEYETFLRELENGYFAPPEHIARVKRDFTPMNWAEQLKDKAKPVRGVDWYDASCYAAWQQLALPTEAQWEFAARGPKGRSYPWGDAKPEGQIVQAALSDAAAESNDKTPEGILFLGGNVSEWCRDTFAAGFYAASPSKDPFNAAEGETKCARGGSFKSSKPFQLRGARRIGLKASERRDDVGIRLVLEEK